LQQTARLFDHLVGAGQKGRGHVEAEGPGGPEVDDHFEFVACAGRENGNIAGLGGRNKYATSAFAFRGAQRREPHGGSGNASKTKPAKLLAVFVVDTNETERTMPFGN
jgi:hypothetical protein